LCAASEWPRTQYPATANGSQARAPFRVPETHPSAARGAKTVATAGKPCVRYQCQGCVPYAALPPSFTLNLKKFHAATYVSPEKARSTPTPSAIVATATGRHSRHRNVAFVVVRASSVTNRGRKYVAAVGRIRHAAPANATARGRFAAKDGKSASSRFFFRSDARASPGVPGRPHGQCASAAAVSTASRQLENVRTPQKKLNQHAREQNVA